MIYVQKERESGARVARRAGRDIARFGEELTSGVSDCVRNRPMESVLASFAGGLLLGRFRIRPVEALILAALIGLGGGLLLSRSGAGEDGDRGR